MTGRRDGPKPSNQQRGCNKQAAFNKNGQRDGQTDLQKMSNHAPVRGIPALEGPKIAEVMVRSHIQHQGKHLQPDDDGSGITTATRAHGRHTQVAEHEDPVQRHVKGDTQ